ncbi:hypothetical protein ACTXG6_34060 [Pseudonocardia sp. Cha107L01]|uniref:hypothetical protein n=1 Tax=Pseudonocardia sp. Cha107L01 TaxID=3457576 RepID=UPI00403E5644
MSEVRELLPRGRLVRRLLPEVGRGAGLAAAGRMGMVWAPVGKAGPARRIAVVEARGPRQDGVAMGLAAEPLHQGRAGRYVTAARELTVTGATLTAVLGRRTRSVSVLGGLALLAGAAATSFGSFHAGQRSVRDPCYTVVPQRR